MLPTPGLPIAGRVLQELSTGKAEEASRWMSFFADFPRRWMRRGFLPVMKSATRLMGCDVGDPLWPYETLDPSEVAELRTLLDAWGLLDALQREMSPRGADGLKIPQGRPNW